MLSKSFCGECILKWLNEKVSCPLCRATINMKKNIVYITQNNVLPIKVDKKSKLKTKLEIIINLIKENKDGKFLIFSAYEDSFTLVRKKLEEEMILFVEIKGQCETRDQNIKNFKNGLVRVIFLNSKK